MIRLLTWPARRPVLAILIALAAALLAALGVSRFRPDASLENVLSREDPAARAVVRVLNNFSAAEELLLLASTPPAQLNQPPSPQTLLAFAQRLEENIRNSPEVSAIVSGVSYRADPRMLAYFEQVLVPNGLFYLDDAGYAAARQRLTPEAMRTQIQRNEAMIAAPGPAAEALAKAFLKDPLRLHEFVLQRLEQGRPFKTYQGSDAFLSPDGYSLLIRISGARPPSDLDFARKLTAAVDELARRVNDDHLELHLSGAYAIATASERAIRRDMISSVVSSVALLAILFAIAYRRSLQFFLLSFGPVAIGIFYAFGVYSLFTLRLTPITAVIGGILAGMGIDYSIHYASHYLSGRTRGLSPLEAVTHTVASSGAALAAAWATSAIGFFAIGWSSVSALRDFALLGALGLAGAFLGSVFLLPALLVLRDRWSAAAPAQQGVRLSIEPVLGLIARRRRRFLLASAGLALLALGVVGAKREWFPLESDLSVMHPRPNPALEAQSHIARRLQSAPGSFIIHLQAPSSESLVSLAHAVERRLQAPQVRAAGVVGGYSLATLLPDPAVVPSRLAATGPELAERIVGDFHAAIDESVFAPEAFAPYEQFLRRLLTPQRAPRIADLLGYPSVASTLLPTSALQPGAAPPTEAISLLFLDRPLEDAAARGVIIQTIRDALAELPGATLTGLGVISHDTHKAIQRDLPRLTLLALGAVLLYLALHFRNWREPVLAMLPTLFSLLCTIAAMHLAGQRFNMVNLVAIPLLIAVDIDYGIFLVHAARHGRGGGRGLVEQTGAIAHAITLCAVTTLFGFGSLMLTSVPAIQSLGFAVGVGVFSCWVGTLFLLFPALLWVHQCPPPRPEAHDHAH